MTNPTPISTASSSDDLVEIELAKRVIANVELLGVYETGADLGHVNIARLVWALEHARLLRQPVAGDVVERRIDRDELAVLLTRYGEFGTNQESNIRTALKAADAILKLIGGGK